MPALHGGEMGQEKREERVKEKSEVRHEVEQKMRKYKNYGKLVERCKREARIHPQLNWLNLKTFYICSSLVFHLTSKWPSWWMNTLCFTWMWKNELMDKYDLSLVRTCNMERVAFSPHYDQ